MPAKPNPAEETEQAEREDDSTAAILPETPPSVEIADAGEKLDLAAPHDPEAAADDDRPTLPEVAPPYVGERDNGEFKPAIGDQATPLPDLTQGEQATTPLSEDEQTATPLSEDEQTATPLSEDELAAAPAPLSEDEQAAAPDEEQTGPLPSLNSEQDERRASVTTPLTEDVLLQEQVAEPQGDLTPLERDTQVESRYAVTNVISSQPEGEAAVNVYRVIDEKSAEQCWVCGSTANKAGDLYCANCGAQLANKVYWLRESRPVGAEDTAGASLLLSKGLGQAPGFARIFRSFRENARQYTVTEEGAGQPLESYAPLNAEGTLVSAERLLGWAMSLAAALRPLHEAGLALGNISAANISIIGDELPRINDVAAAHEGDEAARIADVQAIATALNPFAAQPLVADAEVKVKEGDPASLAELFAQAMAGQYHDAGKLADALEKYREEGITPPTLTVLAAAGADVGMVRKLNEDSVLLMDFNAVEQSHTQPVTLMVVADGMGGHDSGEVASSIAIRAIAAYVAEQVLGRAIFNYGEKPQGSDELDIMQGGESVGEMLRQAVIEANKQIVQESRARHSDMGTTCVAALIVGNNAYYTNVGDSRGYIYRDGHLEQITEDHSLAWRLVQAGQLAREDIRTFERRNEIYRSLGDDLRIEVDLFSVKLRPYDVLLVCSDGLWEMINEEDVKGKRGIANILKQSDDPHDAVQQLLKAANEGGGEDNIGVVVAQLLVSEDKEVE